MELTSPVLKKKAAHSDFLPKNTACKGRKNDYFTVEKLTNTTSSYMIKVNINSDKSHLYITPLT